MDYEKKYKEGVEWLRDWIYLATTGEMREQMEKHFPELKESEDERIRKAIIQCVEDMRGQFEKLYSVHHKNAIAWLEKQGDANKEYWRGYREGKQEILDKYAELEKQGEQKSFARYKVGDTICYDSFGRLVSFTIANIIEDGTDNPMYEDKDGNSVFQNDIVEQKPTDKVEPKFKVKYAGSEYNVFKTKDIAGVTFYGIEDEPNHIDYVQAGNCEIISDYGIEESGLSIPTKPVMFSEQEPVWSEEDEVKINRIVACLENLNVADNDILLKDVDWLKSLRPQSQWKPSDEQIYWLKWAIGRMPDTEKANEAEAVLEELLEQLKKLREDKL